MRLTRRIDVNYKLAIIWGGLRGALTLVLALAVTEHAALPANIQRFVVVLATGFVLFTLFINGTSLRGAIRLLGVDRLSPEMRPCAITYRLCPMPRHAMPPAKSPGFTRCHKQRWNG
jgi:NhaP-type Na+/H+ or K+/H+ antiporter